MRIRVSIILIAVLLLSTSHPLSGKDLPKIAVWDLEPLNTPGTHARNLTSILVSEISKLDKYEVYSQENVRTLAGWTAERMKLGCNDTQCLIALGQMDIAKLISGSVGKIGNRYTISLNLFDTQNAKAENAISEVCQTEDELIELVQMAVRKLLKEEITKSIPMNIKEFREKYPEYNDLSDEELMTGVHRKYYSELPYEEFKRRFAGEKGIEFIFVKGGCYQMGDTFGDGKTNEKPVHEVCLSDFYLGKYEVTQGQWKKVMGSNPSRFKDSDNHPVDNVSWNDAQEFIRRLNQMSGKNYRLPTEAEWEYAARSGGKKEKWAGTSKESELREYAWYNENSDNQTHPVGQKKPNGLGFYDMSGNVWEWVADWFDKDYYRNSPKNNPQGPGSGNVKMLRGGTSEWYPSAVRATSRSGYNPAAPSYTLCIGFRLGVSAR